MTAVAGSLVGEIGALAGGGVPVAMGYGKELSGGFGPGFAALAILALVGVTVLMLVARRWTSTWIGAGGRVRSEPEVAAEGTADVSLAS